MKIFINDNWNGKSSIDIDEFDNIGDIIGVLEKKNPFFRRQFLIYENIILNSKKIFKFYQISENSEIWFGSIWNYLKEFDEIIVEMFISAFGGDIIYVISKKSESISNIRSKIDKIVDRNFNIWDIKGCRLGDDQIISSIDFDSGYYKLIICLESESDTFEDCCGIYDRYLISDLLPIFLQYDFNMCFNTTTTVIDVMTSEFYYWLRFIPIEEIFRFLTTGGLEQIGMKVWKEGLDKAKEEIISTQIFDCDLPLPFVNSRFLLWEEIFNTVDKLLTDFLNFHNMNFQKIHLIRLLTSTFISISIINYINNQSDIANKSMKNILIDILDFSENVFNYANEKFEDFLEHFVNLHTITKYNFSEIFRISQDYPRSRIYSLPFHFNGKLRPIFPRNVKSILDAKKLISFNTKLPIEKLYFTNPNEKKQPNDEDEFDGMESEIEFVYGMDGIEIMRNLDSGAFGDILLCQDKLSKDQFLIKVQQKSEYDLSRDISIQCRIKDSKNFLSYSKLFNYNGQICFSMKYLPGGSISAYLKEHELSEQQIAKWCLQILLQIYELHRQNITHGDIKCVNIVLDEHNNAYLIDFGISKYINKASNERLLEYLFYEEPNVKLLKTLTADDVGTRRYMAPELFTDTVYSNKIDIWSFGVSVIEMVTGKVPYSQMITNLAIKRIREMKPIIYKPRKPISDELKQFIDFCIILNPAERYTVEQLIASKFITNYWNKLNN